jgi:hypothetical protein
MERQCQIDQEILIFFLVLFKFKIHGHYQKLLDCKYILHLI